MNKNTISLVDSNGKEIRDEKRLNEMLDDLERLKFQILQRLKQIEKDNYGLDKGKYEQTKNIQGYESR